MKCFSKPHLLRLNRARKRGTEAGSPAVSLLQVSINCNDKGTSSTDACFCEGRRARCVGRKEARMRKKRVTACRRINKCGDFCVTVLMKVGGRVKGCGLGMLDRIVLWTRKGSRDALGRLFRRSGQRQDKVFHSASSGIPSGSSTLQLRLQGCQVHSAAHTPNNDHPPAPHPPFTINSHPQAGTGQNASSPHLKCD